MRPTVDVFAPAESARRAALRFLAAALGASALAVLLQDAIVQLLLPFMRAWLLMVDSAYATLDFSLVAEHGESMIRRVVAPAGVHVVDGRVLLLAAQSRIGSSACAGIVVQPIVLAVALLAAIPARGALQNVVRIALAALSVACVLLLDVPLLLYGYAWYQETEALAPQHISPLVVWGDAMNAGGRFALTFVAVSSATAFARWLCPPRTATVPRYARRVNLAR